MSEQHQLMGGKLHLYKRPGSTSWQCSTYLSGRNHRVSTKEDSLSRAKEFAEDWYLELRGKLRSGELRNPGITFRKAADGFIHEFETLMQGQRSASYIKNMKLRMNAHVLPFFGDLLVNQITAGPLRITGSFGIRTRGSIRGRIQKGLRHHRAARSTKKS